jgi:hypothetical protein
MNFPPKTQAVIILADPVAGDHTEEEAEEVVAVADAVADADVVWLEAIVPKNGRRYRQKRELAFIKQGREAEEAEAVVTIAVAAVAEIYLQLFRKPHIKNKKINSTMMCLQ